MAVTRTSVTKGKAKPKARANSKIPMGSAELAETIARRLMSRVTGHATGEIDIIDAIKEDHKPLKELLKIMKGEKETFAQKKAAFEKFGPTLVAHAKPEEKTWYTDMKSTSDLKIEGLEGDIEHQIADQLCDELKRTTSRDVFMAKVKVLAELVEHHIKEEENEMLPDFKKNSTSDERYELGAKYLKLRAAYLTH